MRLNNYAELFAFVTNFLENEEFIMKHKTKAIYFTRNRTWGFKTAFLFISSFLNKRIQTEIDGFFSALYNTPKEVVQATKSSFTQCRDKIKYTAFSSIVWDLVDFFYRNFSYKKYYGFRLVAIDGSVFSLSGTDELINEFGKNVLSENPKWIKAKVSFATDVLNNICIDGKIEKYVESECKLALDHLAKLGANNLYLFDRGYFGRDFLKNVKASGSEFCFRVQKNACSEIIAFIKSSAQDSVEFITCGNHKIEVRLTKVLLDTGELEYLVTSLLDKKRFSIAKLKSLYQLRWGVEEQFKDMKYAICMENFIGKKANSVKQEFYAKILSYNLSMMAFKPTIDKISNIEKKKNELKTNKRALIAKVKQCFIHLFYESKKIIEIMENIVLCIVKESVPIRKGRKYVRQKAWKIKRKTPSYYIPVI